MNEIQDYRTRTKRFALQIINLYSRLPKAAEAQVMGRQLLRSGTSVGAQLCEGLRAKSRSDLISKFEGCLQELEESKYWLELLLESKVIEESQAEPILLEIEELLKIFVVSVKNLKR